MPRVLVTTDGPSRQVVLDELVKGQHLDDQPSAVQLLERLAWGIQDAERAEERFAKTVAPRSHRQVSG